MAIFEEPKKRSDDLGGALAALGGLGGQVVGTGIDLVGLIPWWQQINNRTNPASTGGSLQNSMLNWGQESAGQPAGVEPGVYGQMTASERSLAGNIATAMGLGNQFGGFFGVSPFGPIGMEARLALGFDALGLNQGVRGVTSLSPAEVQSLNDRFGYGQWSNATTATDPEANNFGFGGYNRGDLSYGTMPGMQGSGGSEGPSPGNESGSQGGGFGTGGGEDAYAKGGAKVFTGPSRPLVGERGSELGIFVKPEMTQPGIQGNERQVRSALMRAILSLR